MASKVLLLCHPSIGVEYNGRLNGRSDILPAAEYEREMNGLLPLVQTQAYGVVISSPLRRCREPAEKLANAMKVPLETDDALVEVDFGAWEGRQYSEVAASDPEGLRRFRQWDLTFTFPGGESMQGFFNRIVEVTHRICDRPEETVAVMSHGGVIRQMICHLLGLSPRQYLSFEVECGKVATLKVFGDRGILVGLNLG